MSSRPGILVTVRVPFIGSPEPNRTKDWITVEVRAHWPHNASEGDVGAYLSGAYLDALRALHEKMASPAPLRQWLEPPAGHTGPTAAT